MRVVAVLLAIVLLIIGLYFGFVFQPADAHPFLGMHRGKHAVLFFGLAILALIWARFQTSASAGE